MCRCGVLLSGVVIVSSLMLLVTSFNVDTFNYVQYKGPGESMFGFSIAVHKEQGTSWVIVGAPEAQEEYSSTVRGGVVYRCNSTSDDGCQQIPFREKKGDFERPIDDKNGQWFGATVGSGGVDKPIVACAPRYVWFTANKIEDRRDPVGTCYTAKHFQNFAEYSPCRTSNYGYHRQGSCQAGFSAGISKDGRRLFVGAPGSWYWQGQMYSIDPANEYPFHPGFFGEVFGYGAKGQLIQQSLDDRPAVRSTPEGSITDDDTYMGYSMMVGDFNNEGIQGVAVGRPKGGDNLEGQVLLYTWELTNYKNITGKQLGAYFGYALAACDVDFDGKEDLIVGAPLHTEPNTKNKYEVGRVYVYYQKSDYSEYTILDGFKSKSRFGLSLSTLGDLNLDGYGDFAVGAPYDGPNGNGAVYIFQGSRNGVIKKYSQVIYAESMQSSFGNLQSLSTFGFSISGGLDLDGNDYPDVAIGAYLSDVAYFFRARPVVKVTAVAKFLAQNKTVSLERKECLKPGAISTADKRQWAVCAELEVCMKYDGITVPERIELDLQYTLDSRKPRYSRMYMNGGTTKTVNKTLVLYKGAQFNCQLREMIYLEDQIVDKLTELEVEIRYSLNESAYFHSQERNSRANLIPIVDMSTPTVVNDSISIFKNCGLDNVCIPNLQLSVIKTVNRYKYIAGQPLEFIVVIKNSLEDSYNTKFYVHLPRGIDFKVAHRNDSVPSKIPCTATFNTSIFACDIGNPLGNGSVVRFSLEVEPSQHTTILNKTYYFFMNVTSANPEDDSTLGDNTAHVSMPIWVDAEIVIEGKSHPSEIYYNTTHHDLQAKDVSRKDIDYGPSVTHVYTVINKGPSPIQELELFLIWPIETLKGDDLLRLLEPPRTHGAIQCKIPQITNLEYWHVNETEFWRTYGIHVTESKPEKLPVFGEKPSKRTIITTVSFYDRLQRLIKNIAVNGEPGGLEYWQQITQAIQKYEEPLTVKTNSSTVINYYDLAGNLIDKRIDARPPLTDSRFASYRIYFETHTIVEYYDSNKNLVYQEDIIEMPGSDAYNKRIQSTQNRYPQPLTIKTKTTKNIVYTTLDGKNMHTDSMYWTGNSFTHDIATSTSYNITTITFVDNKGVVLQTQTVNSEPGSTAYWEQINGIISQYDKPVTIRVETVRIIENYVNGKKIGSQEIKETGRPSIPVTSHTDISTVITYFGKDRNILYQETIPGDLGSDNYKKHVENVLQRYQQPIIVQANTTKTISYETADGSVLYTGYIFKLKEEVYTQHVVPVPQPPYQPQPQPPHHPQPQPQPPYQPQPPHHPHPQPQPQPRPTPSPQENSRITYVTTVKIYGADQSLLHQQEIHEEPGSAAFWANVKVLIGQYDVPVNLYMTTIKVITYFDIYGKEIRIERVNSDIRDFDVIKSEVEITNKITYYRPDGSIIRQDSIEGELSGARRQELQNQFSSWYRESFKMEIITTKRIRYINSSGHILHDDEISRPSGFTPRPENPPQGFPQPEIHPNRKVITNTTFTVYGVNGKILYQLTETVEPGTADYNRVMSNILNRFRNEDITIYTNATKTITLYGTNGVTSDREMVPLPRSSIQRYGSQSGGASTTITFYGSDGRPIHSDTVSGAPGPQLYEQLNQIAGKFGEVRVTGGEGAVKFIDGPYQYGQNQDSSYGHGQSYNHSYKQNWGSTGSNQRSGSFNFNNAGQDLGSFAKGGKGFVTGGIELDSLNSQNVDQKIDGHARNQFETQYSSSWQTQSHDGSHNYLSGSQSNTLDQGHNSYRRHKRQTNGDSTTASIQNLADCTTSNCLQIKCVAGPLKMKDEVHLAVRSRVSVQTLKNISTTQTVKIQSMLLVRISKFQQISETPDRKLYRHQVATSVIAPEPDIKPDIVPLWVVVVSAVAGTLILLLLIFLLYKCGFFKRNRPSDAPERQPLNRNGHFQHGDEAL